MTRSSTSARALALGTLLSLLLASAPLVPPASATHSPGIENLRNGSFEGAPGDGYQLEHSAVPSVASRTGAQAVNLAPAGAIPTAWGALGLVRATPTAPVPLDQVQSITVRYSVPSAPASGLPTVYLVWIVSLDLDGDLARDACLVRAEDPLAVTPAYVDLALDGASSFELGGASCPAGGPSYTLADLQADAGYDAANVLSVAIETVTAASPWPAGADVHVDDMSLMATFSPLVRIREDALNLCHGASFARIEDAIQCAATGATILVSPGVHEGGFTIDRTVILCGTVQGGSECEMNAENVILRGGGENVVTITADMTSFWGFTVENPDHHATGDVRPALVRVAGSAGNIGASIFRMAASPLAPGESRAGAHAILVEPGLIAVIIEASTFRDLASATGPDGSCGQGECVASAVWAAHAQIGVIDVLVDGAGVTPSFVGLYLGSQSVALRNELRIPPQGVGASAPAGSVFLRLEANLLMPAVGSLPLGAVGFDAKVSYSDFLLNRFASLDQAVVLQEESDANKLEENQFGNLSEGIVIESLYPQTIKKNQFRDVETTLRLTATAEGARIDARENDWEAQTRAEILDTMTFETDAYHVDVRCYVRVDLPPGCGPQALAVADKGMAIFGRSINFTDASTPGAFAIVSYAWDFGDGATQVGDEVEHTYAEPGFFLVTLLVTDSDGFTDTSQLLVESRNRAPVLAAIGPQSATEGQALVLPLAATDADQNRLTFGATGLPAGATLHPATGVFTWTPSHTQSGAHVVVLHVTDGAALDEETVTITVADADRAPAIEPISDVVLTEGATASRTVRAADPDGGTVALSVGPLPAWASFVDHGDGTGTLSVSPPAGSAGSSTLVATATSGAESGTRAFQLVVYPDASMDLARVGSAGLVGSPGQQLQLAATITNTGPSTDTFQFAATSAWPASAPASVTLAPGESATVQMLVTVPAGGVASIHALVATSEANPLVTRQLAWTVDVPIHITFTLDDPTPTVAEQVSGVVRVAYADGTGIPGAIVTVKQTPRGMPAQLATTQGGRTDAEGNLAFAFASDASSRLPGAHDVVVTVRLAVAHAHRDAYVVTAA